MKICLTGNPNCGKTTLFNALTGARQKVGNWAGVTVDKLSGYYTYQGQKIEVVDLPGTYSLTVNSLQSSIDERIANEFLSHQEADLIINIVDASNLARNLYLTLQLLEFGTPMIIAVNMTDIAHQRGQKLDYKQLETLTGCPVVPLVSRKQKGIETLKKAIAKIDLKRPPVVPHYHPTVEDAVNTLTQALPTLPRWQALRLLDDDAWVKTQLSPSDLETAQAALPLDGDQEWDIALADSRFQCAHAWSEKVTHAVKTVKSHLTDHIDRLAMNRWLGLPIFLAVMYLMFEFSINIGGALQPIFDDGSKTIFMDGTMYLGSVLHLPLWLSAILAHGIGLGINTVITFVPQIGGLFLFLCFLEDSGYMARAAFVMDKLMQAVGLPGKSFVPLIVGFGCNVPAIMAARTIESPRDRLMTIMMAPFMSCGARLAIFAVFATAFFPEGGATIVFILYLLGIAIALLTGLVMKKTLLRGKPAPYIMELPPYHLPNVKSLFIHTWQRLKRFLIRAGKVIVPVCLIVGSLNAISWNGTITPNGSRDSVLSSAGKVITPVFEPMGVHSQNWPATVGLITGTLAKEVVVGTLNTLYTQNQSDTVFNPNTYSFWGGLKAAAHSTYYKVTHLSAESFTNPFTANEADHDMTHSAMGHMVSAFSSKVAAFAYLLFVLLYIPCVSTIGVTTREAGKSWAWLSTLWSLVIAYTLSVIVYQLFQLRVTPISAGLWIVAMLTTLGLWIWGMHRLARSKKFTAHFQSATHPSLAKTGGCKECSKKGGCH